MNKNCCVVAMIALTITGIALFSLAGCEQKVGTATVDWSDSSFANMTETEKLGQLFCLSVDPVQYFLSPDYEDHINYLISKYKPGALHLTADIDTVRMEIRIEFNGNKLNDEIIELQKISKTPLFIAADFESGAWTWDIEATRFPYPIALGAARSEEYAFRQGKITAVEAKSQGINWLFSPIMNTDIDYTRPVTQMQSFGNDAEMVKKLGYQFTTGCQEAGLAGCLRWFPHPVVNSMFVSENHEPGQDVTGLFTSVLESGVHTVMCSPIDPSRLTNTAEVLKTHVSSVLRGQLGFEGISIAPFKSSFAVDRSVAESGVVMQCVAEGMTMFLLPETLDESIPVLDYLNEQALSGNLDLSSVDSAVRTILSKKELLNIHHVGEKHVLRSMAGIGLDEYYQNSLDISNRSATILKNSNNLIPVEKSGQYVVCLSFLDDSSAHYATIVDNRVKLISDEIRNINIFGEPDDRITFEALRRASEADVVICSFFIKPDDQDSGLDVSSKILGLVRKVGSACDKLVIVSYYSPYVINEVDDYQSFLAAYSPSELSIASTLDILFGKTGARGRLPMTVSEQYPLGHGIDTEPIEAP